MTGRRAALWGLLAAKLVANWGLTWDIQWHMTIGRDSFWIAPHVMVYAAVVVMFALSVAVAGRDTLAGRAPDAPTLHGFGLSTSLGFHLAVWGIVAVVLAAPIDDLWHRLFGLDVTLWSPPHLLGLAGSSLNTLACVVIAREVYPASSRVGLVATLVAAGQFYSSVRVVLEPTYLYAFTYGGVLFHAFAMLAALLLPVPLIVSARLAARRWAPIAAVLIAFAIAVSSDSVARLGFTIVQPESVLQDEIRKDPTSPIAVADAIAERNGRRPPSWPARLGVVYAAVAMAVADPRRRPIASSVVFGVTLFACSGWFLSLRPAFQPLTPGIGESAVALIITIAAALAGGVIARLMVERLARDAAPLSPAVPRLATTSPVR